MSFVYDVFPTHDTPDLSLNQYYHSFYQGSSSNPHQVQWYTYDDGRSLVQSGTVDLGRFTVSEALSKLHLSGTNPFAIGSSGKQHPALDIAYCDLFTTALTAKQHKGVMGSVNRKFQAPHSHAQDSVITVVDGVFYVDDVSRGSLRIRPNETRTYNFFQHDASNLGNRLVFKTGGGVYETGVVYYGTPGSTNAYTQIHVTSSTPIDLLYDNASLSGIGNVAFATTLAQSDFTAGNPVYHLSIPNQLYLLSGDLRFDSSANYFYLDDNADNVMFDGMGYTIDMSMGEYSKDTADFALFHRDPENDAITRFSFQNCTVHSYNGRTVFQFGFNNQYITMNLKHLQMTFGLDDGVTVIYGNRWGGLIASNPGTDPRTHYLYVDDIHVQVNHDELAENWSIFGGYSGGFGGLIDIRNSSFIYVNQTYGVLGPAWGRDDDTGNTGGSITIENSYVKANRVHNTNGAFFRRRGWNDALDHQILVRNCYVDVSEIGSWGGGIFGEIYDGSFNNINTYDICFNALIDNCYVRCTDTLEGNTGLFVGKIDDISGGSIVLQNCYGIGPSNEMIGFNPNLVPVTLNNVGYSVAWDDGIASVSLNDIGSVYIDPTPGDHQPYRLFHES